MITCNMISPVTSRIKVTTHNHAQDHRGIKTYCIWTYNLLPNKPYSNRLQDVINTTSHPQAPFYSFGTKIEHKRWTRVWDEMVLLQMLMDISLPKMGELLVMMRTMISPSGREVPPAESLRRRAKVLLPTFRLETAALHPESPLLFF